MMRICLAFLSVFTFMNTSFATDDVFKKCGAKLNDAFRLICYDEAAEAAKFAESLSLTLDSDAVKSNASSSATNGEGASEKKKSDIWFLSELTSDDPNFLVTRRMQAVIIKMVQIISSLIFH